MIATFGTMPSYLVRSGLRALVFLKFDIQKRNIPAVTSILMVYWGGSQS